MELFPFSCLNLFTKGNKVDESYIIDSTYQKQSHLSQILETDSNNSSYSSHSSSKNLYSSKDFLLDQIRNYQIVECDDASSYTSQLFLGKFQQVEKTDQQPFIKTKSKIVKIIKMGGIHLNKLLNHTILT